MNERVDFVRKHITTKAADLADTLNVDVSSIYRYKSLIKGKKQAAARKLAEPTLEERVERLEEALENEKLARIQTTDSLLELTLNMVNLQDKLAEVKNKSKRFFGF
jgi:pyruvate dehydrogenase complex dehydrogenase (E1) component